MLPADIEGVVVMVRRLLAGLGLTALAVGVGAVPAVAQAAPEVLLVAPTAEEFCTAIEGLAEELDGEGAAPGLGGDVEQWAALFEPEEVDPGEWQSLADGLEGLLADSDAATATATYDGTALIVSLLPDPAECAGLDDLPAGEGQALGSGTFLIAPSQDEFCAALEDLLDTAVEEGADGQDPSAGLTLDDGTLEAFEPEVVDPGEEGYTELADAMAAARDDLDAAAVSASTDGEALIVVALPDPEGCELAQEDVPVAEDDAPVGEDDAPVAADDAPIGEADVPVGGVDAGVGGANGNGPAAAFVLGALGLLALTVGVRSLRGRATA